jgi:hypothetical protein
MVGAAEIRSKKKYSDKGERKTGTDPGSGSEKR